MSNLRVTTAAVSIGDDNMAALGSTRAVFPQGQEGQLRATALVIEADTRVCVVSCDCLVVTAAMAEAARERIAAAGLVEADNVLICPTHTHHTGSTIDVLGLVPDAEWVQRIVTGTFLAVEAAVAKLSAPGVTMNDLEAELLYALPQEATVGRNSRLLLKDGAIGWYGYREEDVVRPSGPFDPDIPLLVFRRPRGELAAVVYCRAAHNIGVLQPGLASPGVYGLVAQELERRLDTTVLYFPGALGSSHDVTFEGSGVPTVEAIVRLVAEVERGLAQARPAFVGPLRCVRRPFRYRVRHFDEAREAAAVEHYCRRYLGDGAERYLAVMAGQRAALAPHQGEERETFLHCLRLGEIALLGVPCEYFARLGLDIRRRSPFRDTCVLGLVNEDFGYVGDREGYELGGYQLWVSPHSPAEPGTGEAMAEAAVALLQEVYDETRAPRTEPVLRPLAVTDALALQAFYNGTSTQVRHWFCPLGWNGSLQHCRQICEQSARGERYDLVLDDGRGIVGWAFLVKLEQPLAHVGIGLSDAYCGRGLGKRLMEPLVDWARARGYEGLELIVVRENLRAQRLYERYGFTVTGSYTAATGHEYLQMEARWGGRGACEEMSM